MTPMETRPTPETDGEPCMLCGKPVPDYEPQYCCSGLSNECGCMGMPIEPCVCSDACGRALFDLKAGRSIEERRVAHNIELWNP